MLCSSLRTRLQSWLRDYDKLQSVAVILLYVQIGCSLVGSLGALYTGVLLINLAIALFALVAIESGSQSLGRTYAFLLFSAILLDIFWFLLFSNDIWHISSENNGASFIFSIKLTLLMEILGLSVRISSAFLWIQMYRLGLAYIESAVSREADFDLRNSFLSPATPAVVRQSSDSDDQLGGSIYDPAYYSSLFEVNQDEKYSKKVLWKYLIISLSTNISILFTERWNLTVTPLQGQNDVKDGDSSSQTEGCVLKLSVGSAFQAIVDENAACRRLNIL